MGKTVPQSKPRRGWRRLLLFLISLLLGGLTIGFLTYANHTDSLSTPDTIPEANGIVVFTGGGGGRLEMGGQLLEAHLGARVFVSGVNPSLENAAVANLMGVSETLAECCIDLDYVALDTRENAQQTALWAKANDYEHVLLVTSTYHMPRAKAELSYAMPGLQITSIPVKTGWHSKWWERRDRFRLVLGEYGKYLLVLARGRGDDEAEREPILPKEGLIPDEVSGE
ncbi:MAG: YdcF family protein [Pseudomonadota bacterium]